MPACACASCHDELKHTIRWNEWGLGKGEGVDKVEIICEGLEQGMSRNWDMVAAALALWAPVVLLPVSSW